MLLIHFKKTKLEIICSPQIIFIKSSLFSRSEVWNLNKGENLRVSFLYYLRLSISHGSFEWETKRENDESFVSGESFVNSESFSDEENLKF